MNIRWVLPASRAVGITMRVTYSESEWESIGRN